MQPIPEQRTGYHDTPLSIPEVLLPSPGDIVHTGPEHSSLMSLDRRHVATVVLLRWLVTGTTTVSMCWVPVPISEQILALPPTPRTVGGEAATKLSIVISKIRVPVCGAPVDTIAQAIPNSRAFPARIAD